VNLCIREADFGDEDDAAAIVAVLDSYAVDPIGGGQALAPEVRDRVVPALRDHPTTLVLLAFVDDDPVGVAVCFFGLSTFRARALLNIHDLAVLPQHRGHGVGHALLRAAEERARRRGCCRLTLEVRDDNTTARTLYRRSGFDDFMPGSSAPTRFLVKNLEPEHPDHEA
jgi:ribosomal protein S18 acetylase RimI-like enzyme